MKSFNDYLVDVGYNNEVAPKPVIIIYGYKNGKVHTFTSHVDAKDYSDLVETVIINQNEIDEYNVKQNYLHQLAVSNWYADLRKKYNYLADAVFSRCYQEVFLDSPSRDYDNIVTRMGFMACFVEDIIRIVYVV